MERIRGIGRPTSGVDNSGLDHVSRTVESFFARLEHEHNGSGQRVSTVREQVSRTHKHGSVEIVSAGMHPWLFDREWQSGLFSQGQSIHVGPQQNDSTLLPTSGLSPQDHHHSRRIFVFDDLYRESSEFAHDYLFGPGELEA
jgi:hypothetical protein